MLSRVNCFAKELRSFSKFSHNSSLFNYYSISRMCFSFNPRHKPNDLGNNNPINDPDEHGKYYIEQNINNQLQQTDSIVYCLKIPFPYFPLINFTIDGSTKTYDFVKLFKSRKNLKEPLVISSNINPSFSKIAFKIDINQAENNRLKIISDPDLTRYKLYEIFDDNMACKALELKENNLEQSAEEAIQVVEKMKELKGIYNSFLNFFPKAVKLFPEAFQNLYQNQINESTKLFDKLTSDMDEFVNGKKITNRNLNTILYKILLHYMIFISSFNILSYNQQFFQEAISFFQMTDHLQKINELLIYINRLNASLKIKIEIEENNSNTQEELKKKTFDENVDKFFKSLIGDSKHKSMANEFRAKIESLKNIPDSVKAILNDEISNFESSNDSERGKISLYLDTALKLPWNSSVEPFWDMQFSQEMLEKTHYGLSETKERILEFIAKCKHSNFKKGLIILMVGPPGVGKTSIAKSIANCLKRPYSIISLSGQSDPVHIKGIKRTYVGSHPGIMIKEINRLGINNPVIIIDEIDKMGHRSFKGDMSTTLLEILNMEQNHSFVDHYLEFPFDFSNCIFICTANTLDNFVAPFLDRIEIMQLYPYLPLEKFHIAKKYLIPNILTEYCFNSPQSKQTIRFTDKVIYKIIKEYCHYETGVRNLRKNIDKIVRKITVECQSENIENEKVFEVNESNLEKYLDEGKVSMDSYYEKIFSEEKVGTCIDLMYMKEGYCEINKVQVVKNYIENEGIKITGSVKKNLKESLDLIKLLIHIYLQDKYPDLLDKFLKSSLHIHISFTSTPKENSETIASIFLSILSYIFDKPLKRGFGITGEITSTGKLIKCEGIREKITACKTYKLKNLVIPISNKADVEKLPQEFLQDLNIFYISRIEDLVKTCFNEIPKTTEGLSQTEAIQKPAPAN